MIKCTTVGVEPSEMCYEICVLAYKCGALKAWEIGRQDFKAVINAVPSADVVEVVRCGRCEWWKCNPNTEEYGVCKKVSYDDFEVVMDSDDFCSYGKRREDGEA